MGILDGLNLPTMADMNRVGRACPKGPSRLEVKEAAAKAEKGAEDAFRKAVIARDGKKCRCCGVKVAAALELTPRRLEVHHIYGRLGTFRHAVPHALVLCRKCHGKVTGEVNAARIFLVQKAAHMVTANGKSLIDAAKPIQFTEKTS